VRAREEELCGPQLAGSGVPLELWGIVFDKLRHEVFDAGNAFQLASVQADNCESDGENSDVLEGSALETENTESKQDADATDQANEDDEEASSTPLVLAAHRSLNKCEDVWLLDHAWTFRIREARKHLEQNVALRQRMGTMLLGDADASVDRIYNSMWAKASTYRVATEASLDEECCWYVMDEVGTAISLVVSEEESNCRCVPLFYPMSNMAISVMWMTKSVEAGDMITFCPILERNLSPGIHPYVHFLATEEGDQDALEQQFMDAYDLYHDTVASQWAEVKQHTNADALPTTSNAQEVRVLDAAAVVPYQVASDLEELVQNIRSDEDSSKLFTFSPHLNEADIIWVTEFQVSQIGVESVLCHKGHLQRAVRTAYGDPEWLPRTYDAANEMHLFVGDYLTRKKNGQNNLWISKPHCMARSMDMVVTDCLPLLLRQSETGPKLLCKYIERPCLFQGRKFDLRVIVGVQQLVPHRRVFLYDRVWPRFALEQYDLNDLDMYEKHWTVMNYGNPERMINLLHKDFIVAFDEQHGAGRWELVMGRMRDMIGHVFDAVVADAAVKSSIAPHGVTIFGFDVMLTDELTPMLLEATFSPDCHRACVQYPSFFADVFSTLMLNKPKNFTLMEQHSTSNTTEVREVVVTRDAS
ncbi:Hypothetical protein, putative, partial [Bodo saltans]